MTEQHFVYEPYGWDISVFYEVECKDTDRIVAELKDIGCYGENLFRARKNIESCSPNSGVTYANLSTKEMVVIMTKTTSPAQFMDTFVHELHHMAEFIAKADGVPMVGEEISYISGDLSRQMLTSANRYLCQHCRDNHIDVS